MISLHGYVTRNARHVVVVAGLFVCFTVHNYMQELIMSQPNFYYGGILAFLDVLGVTFFSGLERVARNEAKRVAPWRSYLTLCLFLGASSYSANAALNFINYPMRVVFRSCKLVPTILVAMFLHRKKIQASELVLGATMSLGMVLFAVADFQVSTVSSPYGIFLVSFSVLADSVLPNYQVEVFAMGASRAEVTFCTNLLCLGLMLPAMTLSGDLQGALLCAYNDSWICLLMAVYTLVAYLAVSCHMTLVRELGSVAAVIVGNLRKSLTIVLSFLFFPKPFSIFYVFGVVLVFGSVVLNVVLKEQRKTKTQQKYCHDNAHTLCDSVGGGAMKTSAGEYP